MNLLSPQELDGGPFWKAELLNGISQMVNIFLNDKKKHRFDSLCRVENQLKHLEQL